MNRGGEWVLGDWKVEKLRIACVNQVHWPSRGYSYTHAGHLLLFPFAHKVSGDCHWCPYVSKGLLRGCIMRVPSEICGRKQFSILGCMKRVWVIGRRRRCPMGGRRGQLLLFVAQRAEDEEDSSFVLFSNYRRNNTFNRRYSRLPPFAIIRIIIIIIISHCLSSPNREKHSKIASVTTLLGWK